MLAANLLSRFRNGFQICGADKGSCHFGISSLGNFGPNRSMQYFFTEAWLIWKSYEIMLVRLPVLVALIGELRINYTAEHSVEEEEASTFRQQGISGAGTLMEPPEKTSE